MGYFSREGNTLIWQENQQKVWIRPWGTNGLRVRANLVGKPLDLPQALLEPSSDGSGAVIEIAEENTSIRNGMIQATIGGDGRLKFHNTLTDQILLEEPEMKIFGAPPPSRHFKYQNGGLHKIEAWFKAQAGERFFGLGQHQHGHLDQKGCVIELHQRNTEVTIPFLVSNRKYGFLWNNPGIGRVELGRNATRWVADGSRQLDYYIVCGKSYADILEQYTTVTGRTSSFPEWASGFWQCKLRYETQDELLGVAREYKKRGLPLSVIVADFFHWTRMGDWKFDPDCWPDPAGMVHELEAMGVKLMVSIWPTVSPLSENYQAMTERGLLINNEQGVDAQHVFLDNGVVGPAYFAYYDATNPQAQKFHWDTVKRNYYDNGVKLFWLDNDEPDVNPWDPENLRFFLGNGVEVANIYPLLNQKAFYDGLRDAGESEPLTLSRSGWAGSQRYGSVIWSGDIPSTFESLQAQVRAGLNMAMSGIPWWTTDVGGFFGGDVETEYFRELIVRWFQYGVFCPVLRLHGYRLPVTGFMPRSGADNEVWSFGEETYKILKDLLALRERLRPYIHELMQVATERGIPPLRPLFLEFPEDAICETIEDQFMLGPEMLVAPVLVQGAHQRKIYLPAGQNWIDAWSGDIYSGGRPIEISASLETIPVFLKAGSRFRDVFRPLP
ncbi:MAG TPA: glycoside hydrolase family 31 protein [Anaerolineales bacterium]|nr:glycoside hydrolase family 31 protein [Anaerolineales bacterium]